MGAQLIKYTKNHWRVHFKMVKFMVYEWSPIKKKKKKAAAAELTFHTLSSTCDLSLPFSSLLRPPECGEKQPLDACTQHFLGLLLQGTGGRTEGYILPSTHIFRPLRMSLALCPGSPKVCLHWPKSLWLQRESQNNGVGGGWALWSDRTISKPSSTASLWLWANDLDLYMIVSLSGKWKY